MAISHIASSRTTSGGSTGSFNVTIPATATTGRLIVATQMQSASTTTPTFTAPSGWTAGPTITLTGLFARFQIFYRLAIAGTAGSVVAFTSNQATGNISVGISIYDGVDQTTPVVATGSTNSGTMSTTAPVISAVTMTAANSYFFGYCCFQNAAATFTAMSTMTERQDVIVGGFIHGIGDEGVAATGTTGSRTWTASASAAAWASLGIGINPAAAAGATLTQSTFRGRNDDGNETTATWKATAGTDWTQLVDTNFRVRFNINDSVAAATQNTAFVLRYSLNGGAYTAVSGASTVVRATASPNVADGAATTEQLAGAGTFNAGTFDEVDGSALGFTAATATGQDTEVEYCAQIRSADVADGDTVNLRVYIGTTALDAYTDTPIITVSEPPPAATSLVIPTETAFTILRRR